MPENVWLLICRIDDRSKLDMELQTEQVMVEVDEHKDSSSKDDKSSRTTDGG